MPRIDAIMSPKIEARATAGIKVPIIKSKDMNETAARALHLLLRTACARELPAGVESDFILTIGLILTVARME